MPECAVCMTIAPPPGASNDELPFQLVELLWAESREGAHVTSCRSCGRLFLHFWAERGGPEPTHPWRYWVPISAAEAERFRALFALDPDEALREIRRFIDTRRRLERNPEMSFRWSEQSGNGGVYSPT